MGEVYRARDTRLDRDVALKILPAQFANDAQAVARFTREAKAVASLSHPNIVTLHDIGTEAGYTFVVMELLNGQTLGARLKQSPLDRRAALDYAIAIAEGLVAAHAKGVIHRDIKPDNVFLTSDGGLKILDFGLARLTVQASKTAATTGLETQLGVVMGTVAYMSPEQVRGLSADARSDIFSVGCVIYEMVGGRRPFEGHSDPETFAAILHENPPDLSVNVGSGPHRIIRRCLEKTPDRRYHSAHELASALRKARAEIRDSSMDTAVAVDATATDLKREPARSIAVLPFVNMSSDPENEYFSDGLAEELIAVLSKVDGLHLASRTSSFAFKGKNEDIRRIGEQLTVGAVLEGSVRKSGNRLRISAQLVSVANGYRLWSETYNRQLEDIFEIQDEIASSIAEALQLVLTDETASASEEAAPVDVKAYDYYLRGRQFFHQFRRSGYEFAQQMFAKAIDCDPQYARAFAGIADCHSLLYSYWDSDDAHLRSADEASLRALELAPDVAESHVSRGMLLTLQSNFTEARSEFGIAMRLDPKSFEARYFFGRALLAEGRLEEAAVEFEAASQLRTDDFQALGHLAGIYDGLKQKEKARASDRKAIEVAENHLTLHPDDARALYLSAVSMIRLGENERGLQWADRALKMDPNEPVTLYNVACVYSLLGQLDAAVGCLEKAVANGFGHIRWIENDSDLDPIRSQDRFQTLLKKLRKEA